MRGIKLSLLLLVALFSADPSTQAGYVPPGRIASLVRDYIIKQAGEGEGRFQVEVLHIPQDVDEGLILEVIPSPRRSFLGTYLCKLGGYSQRTLVREIPLVVRVKEVGKVLVAKRLIPRHWTLTLDDLKLEKRRLPLFGHRPLRGVKKAVGQRSTRRINRGAIITADMVEPLPLVERGEIVDLTLHRPGLCLKARGKALRDGWEGDTIKVRVLASGKELQARVEKGKVLILN